MTVSPRPNGFPQSGAEAVAMIQELEAQLNDDPNNPDLLNRSARLWRTLIERNWSKNDSVLEVALSELTLAIEGRPADASIRHNRAALLRLMAELGLGDTEACYVMAREDIQAAIEAEDLGVHWWLFARICFEQGDAEQGRVCIANCKDRFNHHPPARLAVGVYLLDYACGTPASQKEALLCLKQLVRDGTVDPAWADPYFVKQAKESGHPAGKWLDKLVEVVAGRAEPRTLSDWHDWYAA